MPSDRRWARVGAGLVAAAVLWLGVGVGPVSAGIGDTEPFLAQQWGLRQIGAIDAWSVSRGAGARIGVIDTGADLTHVELSGGKIVASTRCIGTGGQAARCGGSAQDDNGHGTHVAGTIAAPLNREGVAGVAPESSLLVVKALDASGGGEAVDVAAGIDWLVARNVSVINLSLADATAVGQVLGSPIETAIRRAFADHGVVVVLAGGNKAGDGSTPPGAQGGYGDLPALVAAATGPEGAPARYNIPLGSARWGLAAPGGDSGSKASPEREIVSTYWYSSQANGYAWSEGTSMAAPHVAGVAGLLAAQGVHGQAAVDRILGSLRPLACGSGCRGSLDGRAALGAQVAALSPPATVARTTVTRQSRPRATQALVAPTTSADVKIPGQTTPIEPALPVVADAVIDPPSSGVVAPPVRAHHGASRPRWPAAVAAVMLVLVSLAAAKSAQQRVRRTVTTLP